MAKRVIQECDLTKQEYDPEETVVLIIKKKGKQTGRTYELSADAAEKLEQQLVAGNNAILPKDWSFTSVRPRVQSTVKTLADLEEDELSTTIDQKKAELREQEVVTVPVVDNGCRHLNKGPVQTTLRDKKRFVYRKCRECRQDIPERTAEEKRSFMESEPDGDVRVKG